MSSEMPEVEAVRRQKRAEMLEAGKQPYPAEVNVTHSLKQVREAYGHLTPDTVIEDTVTVAGRVLYKRGAGKIAFATLQEGDGTRLQVMLMANVLREDVSEGKAEIKRFAREVDLGDFIRVTGFVSTSIAGELSVRATDWELASKALRPLPVLHADLTDELAVRQRYTQLIVDQDAKDLVRKRSLIVRALRRYFEDEDFLEVETPILQNVHGGALARPFKTHLNAFDQEMSLRIALELNLKKAVVGGIERAFEIGKVFRNEGVDSTHSPEFTLLEAYEAYGNMYSAAHRLRGAIEAASRAADATQVKTPAGLVDLNSEDAWGWLSVYDAVSEAVGIPVTSDSTAEELQSTAARFGVSVDPAWPAGKIVMELCSELVEPNILQPTFLYDYPAEAQPLARRSDDDPRRILAWDLIIAGHEYGTGFTELIDPVIQREILTEQSLAAAGGDPEAMELDEDFLRALEYGAPPMGGLGLGVDRLVMLFTGVGIREAILFPLLRREA